MTIVARAIVAGIVGGLLTAVFVVTIGEDSINAAIAIEEAAGGADEDPLFSRDVQVVGGVLAAVIYGLLTGTAFGTVFAAVRHKLRLADDFRRSVLLAAIAFLATALVPAIKYPANPPAVGDPATVNERTMLYFTLVGGALVVVSALGLTYNQLRERFDQPTTASLTFVAGVIGFVGLMVIWPDSPDTVPADFPADLLWRFRLQSLTALAVSWAAMGVVLGWLLSRLERTSA